MNESPSTLLNAIEEVARKAGNIALHFYRDRPAVEIKADGSPVTIADRSAERAAREWIASRFPDDGIVGEELGASPGRSARRWIIDPIDGTKSFVAGVPLWGTLIAVCEGETVLAGAVYCAAVGEMLVAADGEGCFLNGSRARVSAVANLAEATVLTTGLKFERRPERQAGWQKLVAAARIGRTWGDCYGYLLVATGRAEVMTDAIVAEWDTAAVQRCVVEAGGVFTDWAGKPTAFGGSAIATNAFVADEARRLLQ
jgi:histidinol phosphatase-like enzyme (inositol monophosphatase family)